MTNSARTLGTAVVISLVLAGAGLFGLMSLVQYITDPSQLEVVAVSCGLSNSLNETGDNLTVVFATPIKTEVTCLVDELNVPSSAKLSLDMAPVSWDNAGDTFTLHYSFNADMNLVLSITEG